MSTGELRQGETTTLTLEISGYGHLGGMEPPRLKLPEGIRVYPDKPELSEAPDPRKGLFSKRVLKYALVPTRSGVFKLGTYKVNFFNPETGSWDKREAALGQLTVAAVAEGSKVTTSTPDQPAGSSDQDGKAAPGRKEVVTVGRDLTDLQQGGSYQ